MHPRLEACTEQRVACGNAQDPVLRPPDSSAIRLADEDHLLWGDVQLLRPELLKPAEILILVVLDGVPNRISCEAAYPARTQDQDGRVRVAHPHRIATALVSLGHIETHKISKVRFPH